MDAKGQPIDDAGDPITIDASNRFVPDDRATERMFQARQALNSLRSIAEWMSAIQGRRKAHHLHQRRRRLQPVRHLHRRRSDESSISKTSTWCRPRRGTRFRPHRAATCRFTRSIRAGSRRWGRRTSRSAGWPPALTASGRSSSCRSCRRRRQNLRQLAEETGGVAFVGRNDFDEAFDRIVQENSSYYVLGYYSTNDRRDGKMRNITVRVAGYPDAQVTYRKRYAAPRGRAPKNTAAGKPLDPSKSLTAELGQHDGVAAAENGHSASRHGDRRRKAPAKNTDVEVLIDTLGKDLTFTENERHVQQPSVAVTSAYSTSRGSRCLPSGPTSI